LSEIYDEYQKSYNKLAKLGDAIAISKGARIVERPG